MAPEVACFGLKASAILALLPDDLDMIGKYMQLVGFNEMNKDDKWRAYRNGWIMIGLSSFVKSK